MNNNTIFPDLANQEIHDGFLADLQAEMSYTLDEQAEHRKELVKALRSGAYHQGEGNLRKDNFHCCLGVACEISELGNWKPVEDQEDSITYSYDIRSFIQNSGVLPVPVQNYFGFKSEGGNLPRTQQALTDMNDSGVPFDEIADVIEEREDELFYT